MRSVLCIGGLDPAGRAGLLADARAVMAMGCRPLCVATALTFQSSKRVDGYQPTSAELLRQQLAPLLRDERIDAIKVGQTATPENLAIVAQLPLEVPLVVDTPLVSTSGAALFTPLDQAARSYAPLLHRATLVTPNADEVFLLGGCAASTTRERAEEAALQLGAPAVLLKGGHLAGDQVTDVLFADGARQAFSSPRLAGRFRGTGCRLAAAITARLALGDPLAAAVATARDWLHDQLRGEM